MKNTFVKPKIIIIPDVHGRKFWREVVRQYIDEEVIFMFLGDYLDPYPYEQDIEDAYKGLLDIIEYKQQYPEQFILLLGNHDLHYLTPTCRGSRWDKKNAQRNADTFFYHLRCFQMTYHAEINSKQFVFSHAGILKSWLYANAQKLGIDVSHDVNDWTALPDLNQMLWSHTERYKLNQVIGDVSYMRGGDSRYGSVVWADCREHVDKAERIHGIIQVFGHTQLESEPMNLDNEVYCLDCRRAFCIDSDGNVLELDGTALPMTEVEE